MAASADRHRAEINGQDIKGGFRSSEDGSGKLGGIAIRPAAFHNLCKKSGGGASAHRTHQDKWQNLSRQSDEIKHGREQAAQKVDATGSAEDSDGDENGHEVGKDAERDLNPLLGSLDKLVIDGDAPQGGVERKKSDQEGNGYQREGLDKGEWESTVVMRLGELENLPSKEEEIGGKE